MTDGFESDPIELLRSANPYRLADVRGAVHSPSAVALREAIIAGDRPATSRRRRARTYPLLDGLDPLIARLSARNPQRLADLAGASLSFTARRTFELIVATPRRHGIRIARWATRRSDDPAVLDLLTRSNPVPAASVAGSVESLRAEMLFDAIVAGTRQVPIPVTRRRSVLAALAVVTVVAASAAGFALAQRHPTRSNAVSCFEGPSLSANRLVYGSTGASPTSICETHVWMTGAFGPPRLHHLVACVLSDGVVGVFPGPDDLCAKLKLAVPLGPTKVAAALSKLDIELNDALTPQACVPARRAVALADTDLATLRIPGWSVVTGMGFSAARPCSLALLDYSSQQVLIDPGVRRSPHPSGPLKA